MAKDICEMEDERVIREMFGGLIEEKRIKRMKLWAIHTISETIRGDRKDPNAYRDLYRYFDSKEKAEAALLKINNMDRAVTGLNMCNGVYDRYITIGILEFSVE